MFATFKLLLVWVPLGSLAGIVGIPYTLVVGDISLLYRVTMWIIRTGLRAGGIRVEVVGRERVPNGQSVIFLCNHVSNLDPPVVLPALPGRCSVLLKKELMSIPILGRAMRMAQFVPVQRGSRRDAAQASVSAAAAALRAGLNMLVFPEGTRSRDGRLSPFKKGPFFLAQQTGALMVPVAISGTERMMHKGSMWVTPGVARVELLQPINPADYATREQLMQAVHAALAAALPESMRPAETMRPAQ
jgi:1-acyl-sn-glycerol-3-phosphate acyltransferase